MKKSLLFLAAMIVSAASVVAHSGQPQCDRLESHCTLANGVRTNAEQINDADRAAIEAFRNVLPGAGKLVDAALSRLDSATTEEDVASIKEDLVADLQPVS